MISHNPACAVVRCGEMRAWCDCDEGLISRLRACEGDYAEVSTFTLRRAADRIEALEARVAGLTHERDFHRETADLHADRIEALEAALSWALIQLGSETGYNMESPIWHAYDRARSVLNGEKQ